MTSNPPSRPGVRWGSRRLPALVLTAALTGGPPPPVAAPAQDLASVVPALPLDTSRLANGLRLVVSEDHSAPLVAVSVWYHVGSAYGGEGRSGFARLVEGLLVQETENLAAGDQDRLVTRAGGISGRATSPDRTALLEVLPSNRINLALWLQAERMAGLRIGPGMFEIQRDVVRRERQLRDEQPHGRALLTLDTLSQDHAPYRRPPLGSSDDLEAAGPDEVRAFYERHFVPANAVLVVVGDVEAVAVRGMVEDLFGEIDGGRPRPRLDAPSPPRRDGERRLGLVDPRAPAPVVWAAYTIPPAGHPDRHALELLADVLGGGEGARFRERLVETEGAAVDLATRLDLRVGPGTLGFGVVGRPGIAAARIDALLLEEVEGLVRQGITGRELRRAVHRRTSELVGRLLTVRGKASALQWHALHQGDPHALDREVGRYEAVTPEDVRRVARLYLGRENRTVVVVRPAEEGGGAP